MSNLEKIREYMPSNPLEVDFIEKLLLNINKHSNYLLNFLSDKLDI